MGMIDQNNIRKTFKMLVRHRFLAFFAADMILIAASVFLAFAVRFEGNIPGQYAYNIVRLILMCEVFTLPVFYYQRLYSISWSYVSMQDLVALFKGTLASFLLNVSALFMFRESPFFSGFPRSTVVISYFFIFILCGGIRFSKRLYFQLFPATGDNKARTLIIGAGDAGEQIARSIINSRVNPYLLAGFVDDNKLKWGNLIHGVKVIGPVEKIQEIVRAEAIEEIIIALPSAGSKAIKKAVELGRNAGVKSIKVVPSISEVINGKISIASIREVEVEDLLEREPITLNTETIKNFLNAKTILVTGGAGSIGSELCRQIAKFNPAMLLILDQDETGIFNISRELVKNFPNVKIESFVADICDRAKVDRIFDKFDPKIVFHAAAYKHVPLMEVHFDEAVKNNIFGTKTVALAALAHHAERFIFISTDKAINPTSVMGVTKRIGEMICQNYNQKNETRFVAVRFGNVLNSRGSVIPIFREQIKKGGPVEITHPEMKRYFMLTSEACLLVMQAGAMGKGGEVFVLDMGTPVMIMDLAREMIRLSGFEPDKDIPIVITGIRAGEKLFEELLTAEEGTIATQNEKIFIAKLGKVDEQKLETTLERLEKVLAGGDKKEITRIFKDIVSAYSPFTQ